MVNAINSVNSRSQNVAFQGRMRSAVNVVGEAGMVSLPAYYTAVTAGCPNTVAGMAAGAIGILHTVITHAHTLRSRLRMKVPLEGLSTSMGPGTAVRLSLENMGPNIVRPLQKKRALAGLERLNRRSSRAHDLAVDATEAAMVSAPAYCAAISSGLPHSIAAIAAGLTGGVHIVTKHAHEFGDRLRLTPVICRLRRDIPREQASVHSLENMFPNLFKRLWGHNVGVITAAERLTNP